MSPSIIGYDKKKKKKKNAKKKIMAFYIVVNDNHIFISICLNREMMLTLSQIFSFTRSSQKPITNLLLFSCQQLSVCRYSTGGSLLFCSIVTFRCKSKYRNLMRNRSIFYQFPFCLIPNCFDKNI